MDWHKGRPYLCSTAMCTAQEGDPAGWWDETFNGHTDTKPKGPEAMSLDILFPGFDHVYGIPERATSLALRTTTGTAGAVGRGVAKRDGQTTCSPAVRPRPVSPR